MQVLFADLQPSIVARSRTNPPDALARSAGVLAQAGKLRACRSVSASCPELLPELGREADMTAMLPRMCASPFLDEATRDALAAAGRKIMVLCGFATEVVVLHAARAAIEGGYRVLVPVDACGGMSARTEDAAFRQIEAAGAVTTSVVGINRTGA
ncbi:MAG: isochorismatase family protein [Rhodopila sp.]|jgi:nicotinamidase-related amidase